MDLVSGSRGVHERSGDSGLRTLYLGKYTHHIFSLFAPIPPQLYMYFVRLTYTWSIVPYYPWSLSYLMID